MQTQEIKASDVMQDYDDFFAEFKLRGHEKQFLQSFGTRTEFAKRIGADV